MADNPFEALSLNVLKKIQKDAANAISTYEDPQQATARTKVEAFAPGSGLLTSRIGRRRSESHRCASRFGIPAR